MKSRCLLIVMAVLFVVSTLVSSSYAVIDPNSVIGLWLFNEGQGDIATDSSGKGNDGTFVGGPTWTNGKFGKALQFDGEFDYVRISDTDESSGGADKQLTVAVCFKQDDPTELAPGGEQYNGIVSKYFDASNKDWGLIFRFDEVIFGYEAGANDWESPSPVTSGILNTDTWYYVAFVLNGKEVTLYLDGAEVGKATLPTDTPDTTGAVEIGSVGYKGGGNLNHFFKGVVDEVVILNTVLSQGDVKAIADRGIGNVLGLVAVEPPGKLATTWGSLKE
ncbi:LamG-like jellyroll fold domain-containing protein [Candidatus Poribacteria bacterium]